MENFDDFENKSYVKARRVKYELNDWLQFYFNGLSLLVQVTFMLIFDLFKCVFELFSPAKPKDISGQLALITGSPFNILWKWFSLTPNKSLSTGGANGLGRAIAIRLAQEKCNIVIVDINLIEAQKTALEISEKFGVKTAAFKIDVSNYDAIQQLKIDIESTLGSVDILVNNAGILSTISLREGQPSDIQKVIDVNLTSHFWVSEN